MDKKDIILILLASKKHPLVGTTKLQKLLFLAEKEKLILPDEDDFNFQPYKYGPVSKELYNDLDFLVNIGYITKSDNRDKLNELEINNLENYNSSIFLSERPANSEEDDCDNFDYDKLARENDSVVYNITDEGINYLKNNNYCQTEEYEKVEEVNKKYGNYSLTALLQYVYRNYPDYTEESEIKKDIL
jgi:uncharacterized protein YwgA